jgi:hypothetical protein
MARGLQFNQLLARRDIRRSTTGLRHPEDLAGGHYLSEEIDNEIEKPVQVGHVAWRQPAIPKS